MVIVNQPYTHGYESDEHIRAKIRVATLGDNYLEEIAETQNGWNVITMYEYEFSVIWTKDFGPRRYIADVFFDLFYMKNEALTHFIMSAEIDGNKHGGHSGKWETMKDNLRDEHLSLHCGCQVIRFPTDSLIGLKRKKPSLLKDLSPLTDDEVLKILDPLKNMKLLGEISH